VGFGKIDLYSTHLYSGGDLLDVPELGLGAPSNAEKASVRSAQIDELVAFISSTHDPRHVAILVGDFNIAAAPDRVNGKWKMSDEYTSLTSKLGAISSSFPGFNGHIMSLDDWWILPVFSGIFLKALPKDATVDTVRAQGHTNRHGDGDDPVIDTFDSICAAVPANTARPKSANTNDYYCQEQTWYQPDATGNRIDYIFIERPTAAHVFMLDVSRIRRRAFKRSGSHTQPQFFLSDHLGLEVTLYASPKS
jgi:exonuclease III